MSDAVLFDKHGTVGVVTLNRPDNRNAMTPEVLDAFAAVIANVRADRTLRCVVITGNGSCFSGGADFRSVVQRGPDDAAPHERSFAMYEPFLSVLDVEVPVLGALSGHAVGGGFGLALCCDIRITAKSAKYGANFAKLGFSSGLGISHALPRLVGTSTAAEMLFTGRLMRGDEAAACGLASRAYDAAEVLAQTMAVATDIAASAPLAVHAMKIELFRGRAADVRASALREAYAQSATLATEDAKEGVAALLAKRAPSFNGR